MDLLNKLYEVEKCLPSLIGKDIWQTLDVTYHPPHVERVWCQWGAYRVSLHRIHPCKPEEALFHPHPWPSAIYIASGKYEMGVAEQYYIPSLHTWMDPNPNTLAVKLVLPAGTYYEMTTWTGCHYVRPIDEPVMSVMITGKPWKIRVGEDKVKLDNKPLDESVKENILDYFRVHYNQRNLHG